jgi:hypothetical protein
MTNLQIQASRKQLEWVLIAFFVLVALSLVVIYALDPAVYGQVLSLQAGASSYPLAVTLFFVGILGFITLLIVGVRRHWRWVFWIILVAFGAAVLDIPVTLLQLLNVLPALFPVWYSLYRMGISCIQVVIALWMGRSYLQHGVWAMGRKKPGKREAADLDEGRIVA